MGKDFSDYYRQQAEMEETAINQRNAAIMNANLGIRNFGENPRPPSKPYVTLQPIDIPTPSGDASIVAAVIGFILMVAVVGGGFWLFRAMEQEVTSGHAIGSHAVQSAYDGSVSQTSQPVSSSNGPVKVVLTHPARSVWIAAANYRGSFVQASGRTRRQAIDNWQREVASFNP